MNMKDTKKVITTLRTFIPVFFFGQRAEDGQYAIRPFSMVQAWKLSVTLVEFGYGKGRAS
jgi:hypothetical protein